MIHFEKITEDNYRDCQDIEVFEDQIRFIGNISRSLAKAYIFYETSYPYIIYNDDNIVGFIMYRKLNELKNYLIDKIVIDKKYQNKGFGKKSI